MINSLEKDINPFSSLNDCHNFVNSIIEENEVTIIEFRQYLKRFPLFLKKRYVESLYKILQLNNDYLITFEKFKNEIETKTTIINENQIENIVAINKLIKKVIKHQYVIFLKDPFYKIIDKIETTDKNPFLYEIKENKKYYVIICENNNIHIFIENKRVQTIKFNMKIFLILQIGECSYIISSNKGTFLYEDSIIKINNEKLKKISEMTFKIGENLNERFSFFVYNDGQTGYLYIYDSEKKQLKS